MGSAFSEKSTFERMYSSKDDKLMHRSPAHPLPNYVTPPPLYTTVHEF